MACKFCDHTMQQLSSPAGEGARYLHRIFWCLRCGTLKFENGDREEWTYPMWLSRPPINKAAAQDVVRREPYMAETISLAYDVHHDPQFSLDDQKGERKEEARGIVASDESPDDVSSPQS